MKPAITILALGFLAACGGGSGGSSGITVDQIQIPAIDKNLEERTFEEFNDAAAVIGLAIAAYEDEVPVIPNSTVSYQGLMGIGTDPNADPTGWGNMSTVIDFENLAYGAYVYDIVDEDNFALTSLELTVAGRISQDGSMDGTLSGSATETIEGIEFDMELSGTVDETTSGVLGANVDAFVLGGSGTMTSTAAIA